MDQSRKIGKSYALFELFIILFCNGKNSWNGKQNLLSYILWTKHGLLFTRDKKSFNPLKVRMLVFIAQGKSYIVAGLNLGGAREF